MKQLQHQGKSSSSLWLFVLIFTLTLWLIVLSLVVPTYTQTPKSTTQKLCEHEISNQTRQDADNDEMKAPRTKDAVELYKADCSDLKTNKTRKIYDQVFRERQTAQKKNLREMLKPEDGWLGAIVLFFVLIFKDTLTKWFSRGIEAIGDQIYSRLSGIPLLDGYSLKRYREKLKENNEKLKIPFLLNKPLNIRDIYVPLKVTGTNESDLIDALQAVSKYRRLMVKGSPGSGKTMLLKDITLGYALGGWAKLFKESQYVPILVELRRFSSIEKLIVKDQLVEALKRNGFNHAERFVSQNLKNNKLLLLLDGLDQVSSNERNQVVEKINDFLNTYKKCPVIITCRTAVYRGEFNDFVEQTLKVVEFSDQQIRDFLVSWKPDMPLGKSVEQLMQTLHDRPRIMALVRNPLMLTIIAYLYTETNFVLPHSRTEFYRKATEILLEEWHDERNQYTVREKKQILQHLAFSIFKK